MAAARVRKTDVFQALRNGDRRAVAFLYPEETPKMASDKKAYAASDPKDFLQQIRTKSANLYRNPTKAWKLYGVEDTEETRAILYELGTPKTRKDRWGNLSVLWDFGKGKKLKGTIRWDQGATWFEDASGRIHEEDPQVVVDLILKTVFKRQRGSGTVRRRRRAAIRQAMKAPKRVKHMGIDVTSYSARVKGWWADLEKYCSDFWSHDLGRPAKPETATEGLLYFKNVTGPFGSKLSVLFEGKPWDLDVRVGVIPKSGKEVHTKKIMPGYFDINQIIEWVDKFAVKATKHDR